VHTRLCSDIRFYIHKDAEDTIFMFLEFTWRRCPCSYYWNSCNHAKALSSYLL